MGSDPAGSILLHCPWMVSPGRKQGAGVFVGLQAQPKAFHGLNTRICFVLPLLHFLLDSTERLLVIFSYPEVVREREFANHVLKG